VNVSSPLRGISATASAGFASHLSEYGSAALRFTGSPTALMDALVVPRIPRTPGIGLL